MKFPDIKIIDLRPDNVKACRQTADLLFRGFREHNPNGWPTLAAALKEVKKSLKKDHISRIAVDEKNNVLGWVGGIHEYAYVWELHPLVVEPDYRGQGIGRALVKDLEEQVKKRGGVTLRVGADDEDNMTSVAGVDLYPNVLEHLLNIKNIKEHPYEFYQKMGFTLVGVIPDADGMGKPDIILAKRVQR
jgi:aminoglycoside 6'-N-acetyltransferase I